MIKLIMIIIVKIRIIIIKISMLAARMTTYFTIRISISSSILKPMTTMKTMPKTLIN